MSNVTHHKKRFTFKKLLIELFLVSLACIIISIAGFIFWISTLELPDFNNFENRSIANSTKIYDRTGKIVLYNIHENIRRTEVPIADMSKYIQQATISIEDAHFYEHHGFRPTSFIRALIANVTTGGFSQGGSTIDQQIVKNALLTREKTISRKLKEIVISIKLDKELPKDTILQIYLNESPYGGTIYGVEEASLAYFSKHANEVTLTEAAYLAALPQSPTYYSPFGKNREQLEKRKNLVLQRMEDLGYITKEQRIASQKETVTFERDETGSGKALHFVMYLREYLEAKYGDDVVQSGGLKVISTIDYNLQKKFEEIVKQGALENEKKFKASNASLVAIDPKTGQILSMVGSRDFFDKSISGQFNIATANRQPGSSFKPIVYAAAFKEGYTPETVLFDVPTQFSSLCDAYGKPKKDTKATKDDCYMPENYDGKFRGPIALRDALAQSLNVPAVKVLYLTGLNTAISLAKDMGLSTITDPSRYGLSLVLGGGEVSLLEITNAYGVFANNGVYSRQQGILEVRDNDGTVLEKFAPDQKEVLPESVTSLISSVLSDNNARAPSYGYTSGLYFGKRPVAAKTGTTNDYRDLWVIGYTPSIVIGMWSGNNDNTPIDKKVAGFVLAPVWHKAMEYAVGSTSVEYFPEPEPNSSSKNILKGKYCEPDGVHTILKTVIKQNPNGAFPTHPEDDSQYDNWETAIEDYLLKNPVACATVQLPTANTTTDSTGGVEITPTVVPGQ
jgi:1A family penicillin-binding protein